MFSVDCKMWLFKLSKDSNGAARKQSRLVGLFLVNAYSHKERFCIHTILTMVIVTTFNTSLDLSILFNNFNSSSLKGAYLEI